ncbi:MAG: M28 family peptidase [Bacteroidales bacterium]|nr:M28 family peptidase [Bacteroidales bacterium]
MKRPLVISVLLAAMCMSAPAQDLIQFKGIVTKLSSPAFQGRGYARDGVRKAGGYIADQFRKAGADSVAMQPFTIDINTFPGKMKMSVDGRRMTPGRDFVMREYSPGAHGTYRLYYLDTLGYDSERLFADLEKTENKGCLVVCDFWFTYKHSKDFRRLEREGGAPNAGVIYTWPTPLKFYKAYGEKVAGKPIIWVSPDFPKDAVSVKVDVENEFLEGYETSNVIAKVEGERHDSCYVFTAHYDHLGNLGRSLYYPGANDNASGTAAVITLAAHYAVNRPEFDMYFVAFSGEEANLRGSTHFVENPPMPLGKIKYLFNLDMIGDNNPVQYVEVSDPGVPGFEKMKAINAARGFFKDLQRGELAANSDHWPFAERGVPCILFENENGGSFQYYHTHQDNVKTMSFGTYEPIFRLVTGFIDGNL